MEEGGDVFQDFGNFYKNVNDELVLRIRMKIFQIQEHQLANSVLLKASKESIHFPQI